MRILAKFILALMLLGGTAHAEIIVATVGPMKGQYAALGEQIRRGAELAISDINAAGGINGQHVTLDVQDDNCDPRLAVEVAKLLVTKGANLIVGHYCSGSSISAARIYEAAGILMLSPASTNPKFTDEGSWNTNRVCGRDDAQGSFAGRAIAKAYVGKSIGIINDGSPAGASLAREFKTALNAAGVKETVLETYKPGLNDYNDLVQKLLSADVDILYIGGFAGEAGTILRQMRELASNVLVVGGDGLLTDQFWSTAGTAGEGTLATFAADPQKLESARAVVAEFKTANYNPEGYTLHAYAAVQAYGQAAASVKSLDGKTIGQWLRAGNNLATVLGPLSLDVKGDVRNPAYAWYKWSAGKFTEVQPFP